MLSSTVLMEGSEHSWSRRSAHAALCSVVTRGGADSRTSGQTHCRPGGPAGWMGPCPARLPVPRRSPGPFPEGVPTLIDPAAGVTLRATRRRPAGDRGTEPGSGDHPLDHQRADAAAATRCRTPSSWPGSERAGPRSLPAGPSRSSATACARPAARGVADRGARLGRDRLRAAPRARGRSMSTAVRLVLDCAFDVAGLTTLRWRAIAGNWGSRRVAAAAGFAFDGTVRRLLDQRGTLRDGWVATMTREDPRTPRRGWCRASCSATGWYSGRSSRTTPTGSSRRARTRGPGTGWSACPARTPSPTP